jgi:glycosyltransferase involved in cell wall biosynthesis
VRIAHITATFPPYYAGTGLVCYHNAIELAQRGHEVTVFTSDHPVGKFIDPSEILVRRLHPLLRIGNAPLLPSLLAIKDFDLIHLHYPFIFGAELIRAVSDLRHVPYVITYHSDLIGKGFRKYLFDAYMSFSPNLIFQKAARILVVTTDHTHYSVLNNLFDMYKAKVVEIPNGIDTNLFYPNPTFKKLRLDWNLSENAKVILFVSALDKAHHYKGLDFLLTAIASYSDRNVILVVIGDGDLKPHYQRKAAELDINHQVIFLGAIPNDKLPQYYQSVDLFVLPSSAETFGIVVIEAMACGLPVIANNIPGVRSVITQGVDGYLIRPNDEKTLHDKLSLLLNSPDLRNRMGRVGREKVVAKYNWRIIGDQLESIYKEVVVKN